MTAGLQLVCLAEVMSRGTTSIESLRAAIQRASPTARVVGELSCTAGLLVECPAEVLPALAALAGELPNTEVTELRRHLRGDPEAGTVRGMVEEARLFGQLAIGTGAVERAMQRRRSEAVFIASDPDDGYKQAVLAAAARNRYFGPLHTSGLTMRQLGSAAGVKRAGCVGILRVPRRISALS